MAAVEMVAGSSDFGRAVAVGAAADVSVAEKVADLVPGMMYGREDSFAAAVVRETASVASKEMLPLFVVVDGPSAVDVL